MLVNMREMLKTAEKEGYGIGFFNAVNVEMARAVIETAEEMNSPVIIGTAEILLPMMELQNVADYLIPMAGRASVPVCVHYDHGLTYDRCMEALALGFTSIMYDCSTLSYEENVRRVSEMVSICHEKDVTVEGELGHVGDNEGPGRVLKPEDLFTDPDQAVDYVSRTGVDALAVAVGNAHGDYKFPPKLDFDRIRTISERTGVPLVLHGGSGLADDDFRRAVREGVRKINIFTDLDKAGRKGAEEAINNGISTLSGIMSYEIAAMKAVVKEKITLFRNRSDQ
ncbi:MAG: class II fructose-bisphosphate aldolase [Lachnospiraceae bacterium]|nr:class II fructose-bisphosphate aldolase [Lachnospiraceae bacterium]